MALSFLSSKHYESLLDILQNANKKVLIISPFITNTLTKILCAALRQKPDIMCNVITRFYREDFIAGVSSARALLDLQTDGAQIFALKRLHTKLYIFDEEKAIMGSANFTAGGFRFNHELSILIEDEPALLVELNAYFTVLLNKIKGSGDFQLTREKIIEEIQLVESIRKGRGKKDAKQYNEAQFGADLINDTAQQPESEKPEDLLQTILLGAVPASSGATNIWLKFEGTSDERKDPLERHHFLTPREHPQGITCFPENRKPTGIKAGSSIYLAVLSKDKSKRNTPIIFGRAKTHGYEQGNRVSDQILKMRPRLVDFPIFIRLYDLEYLDTELGNGISLLDLLAEVGENTYPKSVNTNAQFDDLIKKHAQKSHLNITEKAKEYLDMRLDELAEKYGMIRK